MAVRIRNSCWMEGTHDQKGQVAVLQGSQRLDIARASLRTTDGLYAERDGRRERERSQRVRTFNSLANKFTLKAMGNNGMEEYFFRGMKEILILQS